MEAEYRGAAMVACDIMWWKKMLKDLGEHHDGKVVMFCDNTSSINSWLATLFIMLGPNT